MLNDLIDALHLLLARQTPEGKRLFDELTQRAHDIRLDRKAAA